MTYLFDFDGTLVDSMPTFSSIMLNILDEYGVSYGDDIVRIITPLGYQGSAEYFKKMGVEAPTEELTKKMQALAALAYETKIPAKPGVIDTLRALKERGDTLAILTASPHSALDPCLKRLGIYDLFTKVWSCEDFGTTKSDPKIYEAAARELGVRVGEVIFVDDNAGAVKTAREAGMISCGIFDESSRDCIDEMRAVSDRYLFSFSELV